MTTQRGGQQDWTGYVQPYRYYGPGYRGVGYYAVFYQGADPSTTNEEDMDEPQRGESTGAWADRARQWGQFGVGGYAGRGPKGYQRSDERIREDVSDRLMEHPDLDASNIEVAVSKAEVKLTGSVDSRWAKRLAEDIAESVTGVRDVMNQLSVAGQAGMGRESGSTRDTTRSTEPSRQPRNGRRPATADR